MIMDNIVVVGSLNMDLVVRVSHMPLAGETIFGHDFATIPGGKGANQAISAARLGGKITMIGRIGSDTFGETLLKNLKKEGVILLSCKLIRKPAVELR
jgi:ribokinase